MKQITLIAVVWIGTFFGGHALGAREGALVYNPYYYCAATFTSCSDPSYEFKQVYPGTCCCLTTDWFVCQANVEVWENDYNTCYKLVERIVSDVPCEPQPVSPTPEQPLPDECGCKLSLTGIADPQSKQVKVTGGN